MVINARSGVLMNACTLRSASNFQVALYVISVSAQEGRYGKMEHLADRLCTIVAVRLLLCNSHMDINVVINYPHRELSVAIDND